MWVCAVCSPLNSTSSIPTRGNGSFHINPQHPKAVSLHPDLQWSTVSVHNALIHYSRILYARRAIRCIICSMFATLRPWGKCMQYIQSYP